MPKDYSKDIPYFKGSQLPRWWFQICLMFTPIWGRWIHFDSYLSNGLVQPPTSCLVLLTILSIHSSNFVMPWESQLLPGSFSDKQGICSVMAKNGEICYGHIRPSPVFLGRWFCFISFQRWMSLRDLMVTPLGQDRKLLCMVGFGKESSQIFRRFYIGINYMEKMCEVQELIKISSGVFWFGMILDANIKLPAAYQNNAVLNFDHLVESGFLDHLVSACQMVYINTAIFKHMYTLTWSGHFWLAETITVGFIKQNAWQI